MVIKPDSVNGFRLEKLVDSPPNMNVRPPLITPNPAPDVRRNPDIDLHCYGANVSAAEQPSRALQ
jgi:hypothetical protein